MVAWVIKTHLKISNGISLPELNLKDFQTADIGSQPCQALFPASSHANQQGIASGILKDPVNTAPAEQMVQ
jgi:hypothetical protein